MRSKNDRIRANSMTCSASVRRPRSSSGEMHAPASSKAGTVVLIATPSGVGHARKPPIYLRPKDEVECEIEGIGVLKNPVAAEK